MWGPGTSWDAQGTTRFQYAGGPRRSDLVETLDGFTITIKKANRQVTSHKLTGRQGQEGKTRATSHQGQHVLQVT